MRLKWISVNVLRYRSGVFRAWPPKHSRATASRDLELRVRRADTSMLGQVVHATPELPAFASDEPMTSMLCSCGHGRRAPASAQCIGQ